ncbi:MAG: hypothetical protein ACOCYR_02710 [Erythrobacter sp.]
MHKSLFDPKALPGAAFWSSKLGHAALASIAAMGAMVVITAQTGDANIAAHADHVLVEIA